MDHLPSPVQISESPSLLSISRELLGCIVEWLSARDIRVLDQSSRVLWGQVRTLPTRLRWESDSVPFSTLTFFPNVRDLNTACSVSQLSELTALRDPQFREMRDLCLLWIDDKSCEGARKELLATLRHWALRGVPTSIWIREEEGAKELHSYRQGSLFLTLRCDKYEGAPDVIKDLSFSSLCLVFREFPYDDPDAFVSSLGLENKVITTLMLKKYWPYLVSPNLFPHLKTIDFGGHDTNMFSSPTLSVTRIINGWCDLDTHPDTITGDLSNELEAFSENYPNLHQADLTISLTGDWDPSYDPEQDQGVQQVLSEHPKIRVTFQL